MLDLVTHCNPEHKYIHEYIELPDGKIVLRHSGCFTDLIHYEVYEPTKIFCGQHSTITTFYGKEGWYGSITSRPLPAELDALKPMSEGRRKAVQAWFRMNEALAEALIKQAFPEDFGKEGEHHVETVSPA